MKVEGISLPAGAVPPNYKDLAPTTVDVGFWVAGFDVGAAVNEALNDLHLEGEARRFLPAGEQQGSKHNPSSDHHRGGAGARLHAGLIDAVEEVVGARKPADEVLPRGGTALLPAALGPVRLTPQGRTVLLDAYLP